jgi:uncharacterized protein
LRNSKELRELCVYLASNTGTIYSYENLMNMIRAKNVMTIKNYLEFLESAYMFFRLPMFDYSVRRQIYNPGKFYAVDTGLARAAGFRFSENAGHAYENTVFLEMKRRDEEFYYWKSKEGREVDFVTRKGTKIQEAIQVCMNISSDKTMKRESAGLLEAKKQLKAGRLIIITKDEEKEMKIDGNAIQVIPLWKWLLFG